MNPPFILLQPTIEYLCGVFSCLPFFQVKMKVSRSLKLMRGAGIRTRKLARDMLVFWKRVDKEMVFSIISDFHLIHFSIISMFF